MTQNFETQTSVTLENSVRLVGETVQLLDRRVFPERIEWVEAVSPSAVAAAIRDMVTQSSGPLFATAAGMELAAMQARGLKLHDVLKRIKLAGDTLASARPTNNHSAQAVESILAAASPAKTPSEYLDMVVRAARFVTSNYVARSRALAAHATTLLPDGARILTHCWMDTYLVELVRAGSQSNRQWQWVVTETRPFLQGARLTAHTLVEMGQNVTLITDGMVAAALSPSSSLPRIDAVVTAADRVSMDGTVVNKVGTFGIAIAASAFDIPYYALVQSPDPSVKKGSDIPNEERNPEEVLTVQGRRCASPLVKNAWYPAFDATPPQFVTKVVTDHGIYEPTDLASYFGTS